MPSSPLSPEVHCLCSRLCRAASFLSKDSHGKADRWPAMEYRKRFLNQSFMCIAPNHVLLLIGFGYSRISPPPFHSPLPWFPARSWRRSFVWYTPPEAESVLEVSSKISLGLQDCIVTVTYTVTDVSQSSHCATDPKSVRICKQGSKQKDIFLPCKQKFF